MENGGVWGKHGDEMESVGDEMESVYVWVNT